MSCSPISTFSEPDSLLQTQNRFGLRPSTSPAPQAYSPSPVTPGRTPLSPIDDPQGPRSLLHASNRRKYVHYTPEERNHIITRHFDDRIPAAAIATQLARPRSTVSAICRDFEAGRATPTQRGGKRFEKRLQKQHIKWIMAKLERFATMTIGDIKRELVDEFPCLAGVSDSTISRGVQNEAEFTLKRCHVEPAARNHPTQIRRRQEWCVEQVGRLDAKDLVFLDESGWNLHTTRNFGRAKVGNRAAQVRSSNRGRNMTMMVAVSVEEAVIASRVRLESGNAASFAAFLKDELFPCLGTPRKLVLDNVKFHHSPQVVQTVQESPHSLIYLPPYTPEFNLAEQVFGAVKHYIGKISLVVV